MEYSEGRPLLLRSINYTKGGAGGGQGGGGGGGDLSWELQSNANTDAGRILVNVTMRHNSTN